jgi:hypothetical protein
VLVSTFQTQLVMALVMVLVMALVMALVMETRIYLQDNSCYI